MKKRFYNEALEWSEAFSAKDTEYHAHSYKEVLKKIQELEYLDDDLHSIYLAVEQMSVESDDNPSDFELQKLQDMFEDAVAAKKKFLMTCKKYLEKR